MRRAGGRSHDHTASRARWVDGRMDGWRCNRATGEHAGRDRRCRMLPDDVLAASKRFRLSIFQRTIIPGIQTRLLPLQTVMGQMRKLRICTT